MLGRISTVAAFAYGSIFPSGGQRTYDFGWRPNELFILEQTDVIINAFFLDPGNGKSTRLLRRPGVCNFQGVIAYHF